MKNKINFITIIWILFYILIFSLLLNNSLDYLDHDLGWHLRVGEQILQEKSVPGLEYYDYTLEGQKWVDHEWLFNVITFWLYNNFGYLALNLFFVFILLITLIILNLYTQKYFINTPENNNKNSKNHFKATGLIMFFQIFGVLAMAPHLGVRMQEITLLNLLLLLIIIHQYNKRQNYKILFWLLPLFYFWVNAHAGFLIGIFILFFWMGIKIMENLVKKIKFFSFFDLQKALNYKKIFIFFIFSLLAIIPTLFTPYGLKLYSFLSEYTNTFYMGYIMEWLPAYHWPIQYKQIVYAAIVSTFFILWAYFSRSKINNICKYKIDLWHFALFMLFLILSFKSKRHFPLFFIVSFPVFIKLLSCYLYPLPKFFSLLKNNLFVKIYLVLGFLLVVSSLLLKTDFTADPFTSPKFCKVFPCAAMNFMKNDSRYNNLKIFNNYGWGGFMIWTWPEKKLFIDGRLPQYKFADHTLLQEYLEFFDEETAGDKLDEYDIKLVMLKLNERIKFNWLEKYFLNFNEEEVNNRKNYLKEYLNNNEQWKLIYEDKISNVYAKK